MSDYYFRGQGNLLISERDSNGIAINGFRELGNVPELTISTDAENLEHTESRTGKGYKDIDITIKEMVGISFQMEDFDRENLALATGGSSSLVDAGTVTSEALTLHAGRWISLNNINVTTFTSLSAGGTALVQGEDYMVDKAQGMIWIPADSLNDGDAAVASYAFGSHESIIAMSGGRNKEYYLRFSGLNTVTNDTPVVIDLYRVKLRLNGDIAWITDEIASIPMEGSVLYDAVRPIENSIEDRFFKIRKLVAA